MKPTCPKSQAALARALHVSRAVIHYHSKQADAPKSLDVETWREYLASSSQTRVPASFSKEQKAQAAGLKLRLLAAQTAKAERENSLAAGKVIDRDFVAQIIQRGSHAMFGELQRALCHELPPTLAGLDAGTIETKLQDALAKASDNLRAQFAAGEILQAPTA